MNARLAIVSVILITSLISISAANTPSSSSGMNMEELSYLIVQRMNLRKQNILNLSFQEIIRILPKSMNKIFDKYPSAEPVTSPILLELLTNYLKPKDVANLKNQKHETDILEVEEVIQILELCEFTDKDIEKDDSILAYQEPEKHSFSNNLDSELYSDYSVPVSGE